MLWPNFGHCTTLAKMGIIRVSYIHFISFLYSYINLTNTSVCTDTRWLQYRHHKWKFTSIAGTGSTVFYNNVCKECYVLSQCTTTLDKTQKTHKNTSVCTDTRWFQYRHHKWKSTYRGRLYTIPISTIFSVHKHKQWTGIKYTFGFIFRS